MFNKIKVVVVFLYSLLSKTIAHFRLQHGLFLSSALAFDLLLYSLPLFLIGISFVSFTNFNEVNLTKYFIDIFGEFLPHSQKNITDLFSIKRHMTKGLHPINLMFLFFISGGLLGTVRIISRRVFGTQQKIRLLWARLLDLILMVGMGLLFGFSIMLTLAIESINTALLKFNLFTEFLTPTVVLLSTFIKHGLLFIIFLTVFRIYSDKSVHFKTVFWGAAITTLLFESSKYLLNFYVNFSMSSTMVYGALGAFIFYFVWLYYCAMVFVFGACFTRSLSILQETRSV